MSVRVLSKVLRESSETLGRRLVLIALADEASDDGITWLGQEKIAERARLSRTHVAELLTAMDSDGVIEIRKAQRGRRRINVYRLRLDSLAEVDYDRLPFTLTSPFSSDDVGDSDTVTASDLEADGVGSTGSTVSDLPGKPHPSPSMVETVRGPVTDPPAAPGKEIEKLAAPKLTKIDGRDVAFDTLAEVCGLRQGSPRMRLVGIALNGSHGKPEDGIRAQFARDVPPAEWDDPAAWERQLAIDIRARAILYRQKMPRAALTPNALAQWWTDLPGLPDPGRGDGRVTAAEAFAEAQELQRQGR